MRAIDLLSQVNNCPQGVGTNCQTIFPQVAANESAFKTALAIVFGVMGAVSVLIIILAAINMATADGDTEKVARSRKAVIYALVGLIIALSAEAIVFTLLGKL